MKTATNWEDNQLFQEAARVQAAKAKRDAEITEAIQRHLNNLRRELADDFGVSDSEAANRIMQLADFSW